MAPGVALALSQAFDSSQLAISLAAPDYEVPRILEVVCWRLLCLISRPLTHDDTCGLFINRQQRPKPNVQDTMGALCISPVYYIVCQHRMLELPCGSASGGGGCQRGNGLRQPAADAPRARPGLLALDLGPPAGGARASEFLSLALGAAFGRWGAGADMWFRKRRALTCSTRRPQRSSAWNHGSITTARWLRPQHWRRAHRAP